MIFFTRIINLYSVYKDTNILSGLRKLSLNVDRIDIGLHSIDAFYIEVSKLVNASKNSSLSDKERKDLQMQLEKLFYLNENSFHVRRVTCLLDRLRGNQARPRPEASTCRRRLVVADSYITNK